MFQNKAATDDSWRWKVQKGVAEAELNGNCHGGTSKIHRNQIGGSTSTGSKPAPSGWTSRTFITCTLLYFSTPPPFPSPFTLPYFSFFLLFFSLLLTLVLRTPHKPPSFRILAISNSLISMPVRSSNLQNSLSSLSIQEQTLSQLASYQSVKQYAVNPTAVHQLWLRHHCLSLACAECSYSRESLIGRQHFWSMNLSADILTQILWNLTPVRPMQFSRCFPVLTRRETQDAISEDMSSVSIRQDEKVQGKKK